jgi:hypothetical protein
MKKPLRMESRFPVLQQFCLLLPEMHSGERIISHTKQQRAGTTCSYLIEGVLSNCFIFSGK